MGISQRAVGFVTDLLRVVIVFPASATAWFVHIKNSMQRLAHERV